MAYLNDYAQLDKYVGKFNNDRIILTPNRRLARHLKNKLPTATIYAAQQWLKTLWQQRLHAEPLSDDILLTSAQSHLLWKQVIQSAKNILNVEVTAKLLEKTWALMQEWRLSTLPPSLTEDQEQFQAWVKEYQYICQLNHWIDQAVLIRELTVAFQQQWLPKPKKILLVGFDEFSITPAWQYLFDTLKNQQCHIQSFLLKKKPKQIKQHANTNLHTEMHNMAAWVKQHLKKDENSTLICAIPQLNTLRDTLSDCFSDVFRDQQDLLKKNPLNFSYGTPLSQEPIIQCALQLLSLKKFTIEANTIYYLLNTPAWWNKQDEISSLPLFETQLRKMGRDTFSLSELIYFSEKYEQSDLARCFKLIQAFDFSNKQSPKMWVKCFNELLTQLNWPYGSNLIEKEVTALEHWWQLLDDFACLHLTLTECYFQKAFNELSSLAKQTLFNPPVKKSRVQILGLLEAAGIDCDKLWVMGMDAQQWPTPAKYNPLIPTEIQKEQQMPHATWQHEFAYCQNITTQLSQSADEVIFSYSTQLNNETLKPSPFIENLPIDSTLYYEAQPIQAFTTETLENTTITSSFPETLTKGGTGIIKQQAACPFRAATQYRLNASHIEAPEFGLSQKTKGILLHKTLELLWGKLKTQQNLISLDQTACGSAIDAAINIAFKENPKKYSNYLLELESLRLKRLLLHWLEIEKKRDDFSVAAYEQKISLTLGKLTFDIKIDRIDKIAFNQHLLIDYKSSYIPLSSLEGERPDEPQLPLYALAYPDTVSTVAFAEINSQQARLKTVNEVQNKLPEWQATLTALANEFVNGYAAVQPKKGEQTCRTCAFGSFCRVKD